MSLDPLQELEATRRAMAEAMALLERERAARARAERIGELKDQFLGRVAHELRSPLGVILGWAHLLRRRGSEEEFDRGLDVIEQSVHQQASLINDLLDIGRLTSGRLRLDLQSVDPRSFIDAAVNAVAPSAQAKEIAIRKVLDLTVGPVEGDPARLQQVVAKLLANAVKFTPAKGAVEVALRSADGQAEISVADSGAGISPQLLPHLFERFEQMQARSRQHGGLGLGLAIARQLVELHGGDIRAESPGEGRGASFTVRLPLAPGQARSPAPPATL